MEVRWMIGSAILCLALPAASIAGQYQLRLPPPDASKVAFATQGLSSQTFQEVAALTAKSVPPAELGSNIATLRALANTAQGEAKGYLVARAGYLLVRSGRTDEALQEFKKIAHGEVAASDVERCDATLRCAYLHLKAGDRADAIRYFHYVARGDVKANAAAATEAALRLGSLLRTSGDPDGSIGVYEQVAASGATLDDRAFAMLQAAGLYCEKGKGDYGAPRSLEESVGHFAASSRLCATIIGNPEIKAETRCTAELLFLENEFFTKNYGRSAELAEAFILKWLGYSPTTDDKESSWNIRCQLIAGYTWLAMSYYYTGADEKCIEICRLIRSDQWKATDPYKGFPVFSYSYAYQILAEEALGRSKDAAESRKSLRRLDQTFHDQVLSRLEKR